MAESDVIRYPVNTLSVLDRGISEDSLSWIILENTIPSSSCDESPVRIEWWDIKWWPCYDECMEPKMSYLLTHYIKGESYTGEKLINIEFFICEWSSVIAQFVPGGPGSCWVVGDFFTFLEYLSDIYLLKTGNGLGVLSTVYPCPGSKVRYMVGGECECPPGFVDTSSFPCCKPESPICGPCLIIIDGECVYDDSCDNGGEPIADPPVVIGDGPPGSTTYPGGWWTAPPGWSPPQAPVAGCWSVNWTSSLQPGCSNTSGPPLVFPGYSDWTNVRLIAKYKLGCGNTASDLWMDDSSGSPVMVYPDFTCGCIPSVISFINVTFNSGSCSPSGGATPLPCDPGEWTVFIRLDPAPGAPTIPLKTLLTSLIVPGTQCDEVGIEYLTEEGIYFLLVGSSEYPLNLSLSAQRYYIPVVTGSIFIKR